MDGGRQDRGRCQHGEGAVADAEEPGRGLGRVAEHAVHLQASAGGDVDHQGNGREAHHPRERAQGMAPRPRRDGDDQCVHAEHHRNGSGPVQRQGLDEERRHREGGDEQDAVAQERLGPPQLTS